MAAKKTNSKTKTATNSVVGRVKNIFARKPSAKSEAQTSKKTAAKRKAQTKETRAKPKEGKAKRSANGNVAAAAAATAVAVKKKPPSITITRPEATRPPVVLPPPRPLEAPIGAPNILLPKDGAPITSLLPSLRWMYVGGATRYEVEWSQDAHFGRGHSVSLVSPQTAVTLEAPNELKPGTMYKWRVRGGNDAGWGPWSPPESFRSPEK